MKASQSKTVSATVKLFRLGILLILALMLVTACGKEGSSDKPGATPTAATESTGTPTPTAATPSPTAEPTNEPTAGPTATPTAMPTPTVIPASEIPSADFSLMKAGLDDAILSLCSGITYTEKTVFEKGQTGYNQILDHFSTTEEPFLDGKYTQEVRYLDKNFEPVKQEFILTDGKKVTLYTAKYDVTLELQKAGETGASGTRRLENYGYALEYPGMERMYTFISYNYTVPGMSGYRLFRGNLSCRFFECADYYDVDMPRLVGSYISSDGSLFEYTLYTYDGNNRPVSRELYRVKDENGRTTAYTYDESGNLAEILDTSWPGSDAAAKETFAYRKDKDGRLTGWTYTNINGAFPGSTENCVKYLDNGSVLIYETKVSDAVNSTHSGYIIRPDKALLAKLETASGLYPNYWDFTSPIAHPDSWVPFYVTYPYDTVIDYDRTAFFGLPDSSYDDDEILRLFRGDLTDEALASDPFVFDPESVNFHSYRYQTWKDGLLVMDYHAEGDAQISEYKYDSDKRLIEETYVNFAEGKTVTYTYDKDGRLTARERKYFFTDTATGEDTFTTTTYRYTYSGSSLSGMTATAVMNHGEGTSDMKVSTTSLSVYKP
ncbi:MAG: hypothetical protein K6B39_09330 [Lachnospiraceae bacterium]|nr:hypothetical protein [Lachnospiraceae bacterium]